ncbi:uncharacterized protein LOC124437898 [Xenia sp. Carnegie-2017]|uniref:uncharacterized protein LOC124437898 n=1 Tax=Xenia sp. Carnegie-2017 TaxID=2897299 RepID=UPI001F0414F2|nr:uncharacterized protein LOC124437898 [Xenia sp. Carnegie-2017]
MLFHSVKGISIQGDKSNRDRRVVLREVTRSVKDVEPAVKHTDDEGNSDECNTTESVDSEPVREKVPEALNKTFSDRISKTEAIQWHLDRKQLSSTPLFPTYQQQDVLQAKGLDKEKQAASTGPSDPKKTRLCKNCGQLMKGHPKSHCPQELLDKHS